MCHYLPVAVALAILLLGISPAQIQVVTSYTVGDDLTGSTLDPTGGGGPATTTDDYSSSEELYGTSGGGHQQDEEGSATSEEGLQLSPLLLHRRHQLLKPPPQDEPLDEEDSTVRPDRHYHQRHQLHAHKLAENATKSEPIEHDSTHQSSVVYIGDGYVPLRHQEGSGGSSSAPAAPAGVLDWRSSTPASGGGQLATAWDSRRYFNNKTRVQHIEAECQDDYMKIRIGFNGSFGGLLYSSGYSYDPDCVYINGTGRDYYEFYIQLNRCGTLGKNSRHEEARKNPAKNVMWNTVTVQYNPLIEEEWDEHFKVTCEYGYDFWKTVTFPFLDVEVATGNPVVFTLSPPECYMEIRYGYGTNGNRVTGPVRVGDPLTLIIYMRSKYDGFDIVVNDCYAHNGANKRIQLIDQYGCPVDDKLISRFRGSWSEAGVFETQVFAYMKTFRFTGSPALYIECDVRMCHGRCPSQPCHWRNAKTTSPVKRKRSLDGVASGADDGNSTAVDQPATLSQNISLFQSLRVLQEGSDESPYTNSSGGGSGVLGNSVCLRSGVVTWLACSATTLTTLLGVALVVSCRRLSTLNKQSSRQQSLLGGVSSGGSVAGTNSPLGCTTPRCFVNIK